MFGEGRQQGKRLGRISNLDDLVILADVNRKDG